MTKNIVPITKERWNNHVLKFHYTSKNYYDVAISCDSNCFNVSFTKRPFDTQVSKSFEDKLFQPWNEDVKSWGIIENDNLVAVIETAVESWSNRLRISELWIDDAHHRQGIGTALMDIAVQRAKDENRRMIILETQSCNENAIAFYLAYGFTLVGFDACCYGNDDIAKKEVRLEFGLQI